jgi:FkbM family methyltransferase
VVFFRRFHKKSFSQFGEDMIVDQLFSPEHKGYYVDIGAHRPTQSSNTYFFYRKGWRGINIDAMPGSMKLFNVVRPRDINIEAAISDKNEELTFYMFNRPLQNGFFNDDSSVPKNEGLRIVSKRKILTSRLDKILDKHVPTGFQIDLMSVDVEGLDLSVLKSNDWLKYKPNVILIEVWEFQIAKLHDYEVHKFLQSHNYSFYSRSVHTLVYTKNGIAFPL